MSLQFIFGNSGAGKSYTLFRSVIEDSIRHPDQSYLVIVPEQFTMQTQKELVRLHPDGGILNIDILSFQRLAYRVFEETGTRVGKVLEETGKNLVLRKIAQERKGELKVLGGNLKKMGYISEIKSLISELTQYAVTEEALADFLEKSKEKPHLYYKLCDVQVLYKAFHAYLADQYITAEELLEVLCRVAVADDPGERHCAGWFYRFHADSEYADAEADAVRKKSDGDCDHRRAGESLSCGGGAPAFLPE